MGMAADRRAPRPRRPVPSTMADHIDLPSALRARLAALKAQAELAPPEDRARLLGTVRIVARAVEAYGAPAGA
jgi:hypothetical protein